MATAPALTRPRLMWHVRATWSAREDRLPSAVWLGILWFGMIAGFGLDIPGFAHRSPPPPTVLWVHGVVFTVWMLLLTAQVLLVLGDRVAIHRKLGWFAAAWACLMAVMGPWAAIADIVYFVKLHGPSPDPFIATQATNLTGFVVLVTAAITLRKNSAAHKRLMILSTVALADPGFSRLLGHLLHHDPTSALSFFFLMFYGNLLLITLMLAWDWWRGRLLRSFVLASAGMVTAYALASFLQFWAPWWAVTSTWVHALSRHI
jgi:hypothetical protein